MPNIPIDIPLPENVKQYLAQPHCIDLALPKPGKAQLCLPLGGKISGLADATKAIPDDCTLTFSLLLQLGPIMASIECLIKVLGLIKPLIDLVKGLGDLPNPSKVIGAIPAFVEAAEKVLPCIAQIAIGVPMFVKDLLLLIAKTLKCISGQIKSIAALMGGIAISISNATAAGNTELLAQLECAKENAANSAAASMNAIEAIGMTLSLAEPFLGIAGVKPIVIPTFGSAEDADAMYQAAASIEEVAQTLITIAEALPSC
jgi:hypothetical protein